MFIVYVLCFFFTIINKAVKLNFKQNYEKLEMKMYNFIQFALRELLLLFKLQTPGIQLNY